MLENMSALALVPKAKAIGAQRLSSADYDELMRRRSVLEVVSTLQSHPYFKKTLSGLTGTNLHREQIEQALSKDVFVKYEGLMRYSFREGHFGAYFLVRCEVDELLQKLRLLSMGAKEKYIVRMPGFLTLHTSFDLLKLAAATTAEDCLPVLAGTPYADVLRGVLPKKGQPLDYLVCEHAFVAYFYDYVLKKIDADLSGRTAAETRELFLCEGEIYNLDLLFRAKAFYPESFTPAKLKELLIPVYHMLDRRHLEHLAEAQNLQEFLQLYNGGRAARLYGRRTSSFDDAGDVPEYRMLYRKAQRLLHFSSKPQTVLAAVLCIANLERSNIITVIEGVRYGIAPEKIALYLKR